MSPDLKKSLTPLALSGTVVESYISNEQWYRLFVETEDEKVNRWANSSPCSCEEPCGGDVNLHEGVMCRDYAYGWCGADCQGCCGPFSGCYLKADEVSLASCAPGSSKARRSGSTDEQT